MSPWRRKHRRHQCRLAAAAVAVDLQVYSVATCWGRYWL